MTAISSVDNDGTELVLVVVVELTVVVTAVVVVVLDVVVLDVVVVSFAASPEQPATTRTRIKPSDFTGDHSTTPIAGTAT